MGKELDLDELDEELICVSINLAPFTISNFLILGPVLIDFLG